MQKEKVQDVHFEEQRTSRKCNVGAKSYAQDDENFKGKTCAKWNKRCSNLRARPHPSNPAPCEGNILDEFLRPKQRKKSHANIIQEGNQVPAQEAAELGIFGHLVLPLVLRKEGSHCTKAWRGRCMKLGK